MPNLLSPCLAPDPSDFLAIAIAAYLRQEWYGNLYDFYTGVRPKNTPKEGGRIQAPVLTHRAMPLFLHRTQVFLLGKNLI